MVFESITDARVDELLRLPKRVTNPNARVKTKDCHEQINYTVVCTNDEKYRFELYTRQNKMEGMEDDFSCGLSWVAANGETLTLCRYNSSSHNLLPNK